MVANILSQVPKIGQASRTPAADVRPRFYSAVSRHVPTPFSRSEFAELYARSENKMLTRKISTILVERLRRQRIQRALDRAVEERKLVVTTTRTRNGRLTRVYAYPTKREDDLSRDSAQGTNPASGFAIPNSITADPTGGDDGIDDWSTEGASSSPSRTAEVDYGPIVSTDAEARATIAELRRTAVPPLASDVATVLLIASGVEHASNDWAAIKSSLRRNAPVVTITADIDGFSGRLHGLLERGVIIARRRRIIERVQAHAPSTAYEGRAIVHIGPHNSHPLDVSRRVSEAASRDLPLLATAQDSTGLPGAMRGAAQLSLDCGTLTPAILRSTVEVVLGQPPHHLPDELAEKMHVLTLADLDLVIRPGTEARNVAAKLLALLEMKEQDEAKDASEKPAKKTASTRREEQLPTADISQPGPPITERKLLESLTGYGEAKDWALDLKIDLEAWQQGKGHWSQASTALLLSGPPGTGKTRFAKVLSQALQLPLVRTSVATWLEPGDLGDALSCVARIFQEAGSLAPAVFFIDEIDTIGRRGKSGVNADYWTALINRILEQIDKVRSTDGLIIVAATNNPDAIDPAVLRSGRLDTHILIPPPDLAARRSILSQYLPDKLDFQDERGDAIVDSNVANSMDISDVLPLTSPLMASLATEAKATPRSEDDDQPQVYNGDNPFDIPKIDGRAESAHQAVSQVRVHHDRGNDGDLRDGLLDYLARKTAGMTGADLEKMVKGARQRARRAGRELSATDLKQALIGLLPDRSPELRWRMAVHEAGHAIAQHMLGHDEIIAISIDDAERDGYVRCRKRAVEWTGSQLTAMLDIYLAGRAAEEVLLHEPAAGSGGSPHSDLAHATAIATRIETEYGYGSHQPLLYRPIADQPTTLLEHGKIAEAVNERLEEAYLRMHAVATKHRASIDHLARIIFERGTLEGPELEAALSGLPLQHNRR